MFNSDIKNEIFDKRIENVSDVSTFSVPDNFRNSLKNIRIDNMNKLIFAHLNINSLRNKFDLLSEQIKGSVDILIISETKKCDSFPDGQFLIEGYHAPFRFDGNKYSRGIIVYVPKDIPAKVLCHNFRFAESFFYRKINLHKQKWFLNCSYNPRKNNIIKHLELISRSLDTFSTKYENIILLGNFNV